MTQPRQNVLFLCTGNSARSQMAEGLLRHLAGDRLSIYSAGTKPSVVNPLAIAAMQEIGVDISDHYSKHVNECFGKTFDVVVTVCDDAKESCPVFPGVSRQLHWSLEDPAAVVGTDEEKLAAFRAIRDGLVQRIRADF